MEKDKERHIVKVLEIKEVTHDVRSFRIEKPEGYKFIPGQATEMSINKQGLENEKRPFTFTSLNDEPELEFTIKMYDEHENGITKHLREIVEGDEFIIRDVWGAIHYKGQGVFIAGGAGITPFIAILRDLREKEELYGNTLIFSNKTEKDIILKDELKEMEEEGLSCIFILTREEVNGYESQRVSEEFLEEKIKNFNQNFYICGPIRMVGEVQSILRRLGAESDSIVVET